MLQTTQEKSEILAVWRRPFELGTPEVAAWKDGLTILDMVCELSFLPENFLEDGVVIVDGKEIPTVEWDIFVPTNTREKGELVSVTMHMPMQGGGGGGKRLFGLVAGIALAAVSYGIASGALLAQTSATIGTTFGISSAAASSILAAGVSLAGSLVLSALSGPPVSRAAGPGDDGSGTSALAKASLTGNALEPNAAIPRVVGTRRVYPPFAFEPITEIEGQDEYVSAAYVLAGPHKLEDIRIGLAALSPDERDADVQLKVYDGLPDTETITIPKVQGRTFPLNVEMSTHGTNSEDQSLFSPPLPVYHAMATANGPDEAWLHILLYGLIRQDSPSDLLRVPFRIRMRKNGDTDWRYLPEIHYMDATQAQRRLQVKFIFSANPGGLTTPLSNRGFVEARKLVPGQTVEPTNSGYESDAYFSAGSGNDVYNNSTVATTNVINVRLEPDVVSFYLDPADWPAGQYDVEIKRGAAFRNTLFTSSTYVYNGAVNDFFYLRGDSVLPLTKEGLLDRISLTRFVSVRYQEPIKQRNMAMIYLRARNRSVERLSVLASGYVKNWNGTDWNTVETTSNPAAHYRDVLLGNLNFDPIPEEILDLESIQEWHERCDSESFTCDMVVESGSLFDILRILAACGYARPYQSEVWGVIQDYDRSAESPVQIFSPRNSNSLTWKKAFPRLPSGFRVNFSDRANGFDNKQLQVYRNGSPESDARIEQTTYEGITDRNKVKQRASFDLKQGQYRSAIYTMTVSADALRCRKGSLVGVNHDILANQTGSARIKEVLINSSGLIEGVVLDTKVNIINNQNFVDVQNIAQQTDFKNLGVKTGMVIRRTNSQFTTHPVSTQTGQSDTIMFSTPFAQDVTDGSVYDRGKIRQVARGCLVFTGNVQKVIKRFIVTEIEPSDGLSANITLTDEAPKLWENFNG